ncbi:hypothetical protein POTOM_037518 [Populus tomentosa]|uniref:Uncharacterized protein n=1 Tax=Populus tomentosa TaxID=118781 RepID=A0A8X7YQN7_POPTO|nr:hypothetical protein POTOM_037518 [Populus tomentosa]
MSLAMRDSLKDYSSIECDDHGAEYIEGRVKCILSDILKNPDTEMLKQFLPAAIESMEAAIVTVLPVQLMQREYITKRFLFDASKITALKAKAAGTSVPETTGLENAQKVCAHHYRKTMPVTAWNINGASMEDGDDQLELQGLVSRIRKELEEFDKNYVSIIRGDGASLAIWRSAEEFGELAMGDDIEFFKCTSI